MQLFTASSLDKIFPDGGVHLPESSGVMLQNERYHFQAVVLNDEGWRLHAAKLVVTGAIAAACEVRAVECVPAVVTNYADADDYCIFKQGDDARLYPDILRPAFTVDLPPHKYTSFWVTVHDKNGLPAGKHDLSVALTHEGKTLAETVYSLEVLEADLPDDGFPVTHWMHYDGIANFYGLQPWSEGYYEKLGTFIDRAVLHGVNMLYVPLFTPPLDTVVGGERLDVQLVKVGLQNGKYAFDLTELEKFIDFALSRGVKYFEMCHLATQWGAAHCPKICATTEKGYERIFGWDTSSTSQDYLSFLQACLSQVDALLQRKGVADRCYFHISDEPNASNIERYKEVYGCIRPILKNYKLMDAVSDAGRDMIDVPVVSTTHLSGACAENEFAYYCCSSYKNYLSNRFINMPSQRNRVLGYQLYLNKAGGFLHWGLNFYNDGYSYRAVNPFISTDAGGHFPAGDSFVLYPNDAGACDSLRFEVFFDALQDRLALVALEKKIGRAACEKLLTDAGVSGWREYPRSAAWQKQTGEKIRRMLV